MFTHTFATLDSGLQVIRVPMPSVKSVTVLTLCNTGSRFESAESWGVAHFFEHMVFKGTKKFADAQALAGAVDAIGADFNAFTSKEYTGYYVKSASEHLDLAIDVVSDMLLTAKLQSADIEREKGVIVEELNMYADTPARYIGDLFERMVFAETGLAHDIIGTKETITGMQRQSFLDLLEAWYGLGNLLVVVAGDASVVDQPSTMELIERYFAKSLRTASKTTAIDQNRKIDVKTKLDATQLAPQRLHLEYKTTEQAHLILGWPGVQRGDPQRYALSLLSTILGGNMSSRLFIEVREKRGLCYYVHSDADYYHDIGVQGASAGVDPSRVEEAIKIIVEEFHKPVSGSSGRITEAELQKAKDFVAGKMILGLEDSESVAQFYGMKQLLLDTIETPAEVLARYQRVTLEEVQAVAERLIKSGEARLTVIGPFKNEDTFASLIDKA